MPFIIHGTKTVETVLGRVADYCPMCRTVRVCKVTRLGHAMHIYFAALSKGRLICFERKCLECKSVQKMRRLEYTKISKDKHATLDELIQETNPEILQKIANLLDVEQGVASADVVVAQRKTEITDIFQQARLKLLARGRTTHIDKQSTWAIFVSMTITAIILFSSGGDMTLLAIGGIAGAIGLLVSLILMGTDLTRFARREVRPWLQNSLRPYQPTLAELEQLAVEDRLVGKVAKSIPLASIVPNEQISENNSST